MDEAVPEVTPASAVDEPCPVCWHEAGHALVALVEEVEIERIVVKKGATSGLRPADPEHADQHALVRVAFAGAVAERIGGNRNARASEPDKAIAHQAMDRIGRANQKAVDRFQVEKDAERYASDLFKEHAESLRALAEFLCRRGASAQFSWAEVKAEWVRLLS
jgi:hypothetical protein